MKSYKMTTNNSQNNNKMDWESLRKQARQAENEIDSKLVSFSKLCSSYTTSRDLANDSANMLNSNTSDTMYETLSIEIEQLLKKLNQINNKMSDCLGLDYNQSVTNPENTSSAIYHTLQRHREILRDYTHEYDKTKRNIINFREREKLLTNTTTSKTSDKTGLNNRSNGSSSSGSSSNNNSTSLYLKEFDHIKSSHSMIDQQIEIAELTKENLQSQKQALKLIQHKMNTLAHKFPLINSLMQRIKTKKRKDSLILASVIAVCIIVFLLYVF